MPARHALAEEADEPFEQADAKAGALRMGRQDRGRELAVVAGEDDALRAQERYPAARLSALAGLVDHREVELAALEDLVLRTGAGGEDDLRRVEDRSHRGVLDAGNGFGIAFSSGHKREPCFAQRPDQAGFL